MFALKLTYLVALGTWLGSLLTIRYIVPSALSHSALNRDLASEAAMRTIGMGNKLGIACGIAMTGSLFLQALLSGVLFVGARYVALLVIIFMFIGAGESLYVRKGAPFSNGSPNGGDWPQQSSLSSKRLIPAGLRFILFIQIICAIVLLAISL